MERIYSLDIDCAPMTPRPYVYAEYMKSLFNLVDFEIKNVQSKLFGNWVWVFKHDSEIELGDEVMQYLRELNAKGKIRYARFVTLTEEDLIRLKKINDFGNLPKEEQEQLLADSVEEFSRRLNED